MRKFLRSKTFKTVAGAGVGLVMLTGCNGSFAGSGTMESATGRGVATMSFSIRCDPNTQTVSGGLTYSDSAARTSLTARPTERGYADDYPYPYPYPYPIPAVQEGPGSEYVAECDNDQEEGHYVGTYTGSVNGRYRSGTIRVDLQMTGECRGGAYVSIVLDDWSYSNEGCLDSGRVVPTSSTFSGHHGIS